MGAAGAEVVGVDFRVSLTDAVRRLGPAYAVQGNLDPAPLFAPWPALSRSRSAGSSPRGRAAPGPHLQPRPRRAAGHRPGRAHPGRRAGARGLLPLTGGGRAPPAYAATPAMRSVQRAPAPAVSGSRCSVPPSRDPAPDPPVEASEPSGDPDWVEWSRAFAGATVPVPDPGSAPGSVPPGPPEPSGPPSGPDRPSAPPEPAAGGAHVAYPPSADARRCAGDATTAAGRRRSRAARRTGRTAPRTVSSPLLAPRNAFQPALRPPRNPDVSSSGTTTFAAVTA